MLLFHGGGCSWVGWLGLLTGSLLAVRMPSAAAVDGSAGTEKLYIWPAGVSLDSAQSFIFLRIGIP